MNHSARSIRAHVLHGTAYLLSLKRMDRTKQRLVDKKTWETFQRYPTNNVVLYLRLLVRYLLSSSSIPIAQKQRKKFFHLCWLTVIELNRDLYVVCRHRIFWKSIPNEIASLSSKTEIYEEVVKLVYRITQTYFYIRIITS